VVGEKLIHEKVSAMNATLDVNTEDKLQESVIMLRDARRIVLTGIGASGLVARNFGWKLMKIGLHAVVEQDMHALLATTQAMESSDLLLAISYTGERREINMAADEALRVGAKILAITGFTPNALQQRSTRCRGAGHPQRCHLLYQRTDATHRPAVYGAGAAGSGARPGADPPQRGAGEKTGLSRNRAYNTRPACVPSEIFRWRC